MHFCNLFSIFSNPKPKRKKNLSPVKMVASSPQYAGSASQQHQQEEEQSFNPPITCSIPLDELEVICELMVNVDNLEELEFHIKDNMVFQEWSSLFLEFCGPVYPDLVKEFRAYTFVI